MNRRILCAIDEYEEIDKKLGENAFTTDLLALIRDSIQYHKNITWLFTGSHDLSELQNAEWSSYFISLQTIEIPFFTSDETELLLTEPFKYSSVITNDVDRPLLSRDLWGENGIQKIHKEAGGWPYLVQLLADETIKTLNYKCKKKVTDDIFDQAMVKAIVTGNLFFERLLKNECNYELPQEWEYIIGFRRHEYQSPPEDGRVFSSLQHRKIVVEEGGLWRLRSPVMRRWLIERG